jgi:hypothetical protein
LSSVSPVTALMLIGVVCRVVERFSAVTTISSTISSDLAGDDVWAAAAPAVSIPKLAVDSRTFR